MTHELFGWLMLAAALLCVYGHVREHLAYRRWLRFGESLQEMSPEDREAAIERWNGVKERCVHCRKPSTWVIDGVCSRCASRGQMATNS